MKRPNLPDMLGGLDELKKAAEAMRDAVRMIEVNREQLQQQQEQIEAHERQLNSLEKRYSDLLYAIGEMRRGC